LRYICVSPEPYFLELIDFARALAYYDQPANRSAQFSRQPQAGVPKPTRFHDRKRHVTVVNDLSCAVRSFSQFESIASMPEYSGQTCPQRNIARCNQHPSLHFTIFEIGGSASLRTYSKLNDGNIPEIGMPSTPHG
jgi:hypothetical protein